MGYQNNNLVYTRHLEQDDDDDDDDDRIEKTNTTTYHESATSNRKNVRNGMVDDDEPTKVQHHAGRRKQRLLLKVGDSSACIPAHENNASRNDNDNVVVVHDDEDKKKQSPTKQQEGGVLRPNESCNMVVVPENEIRPKDVLCGRQRASRLHAGNVYFRQLIAAHRDIYTSTTGRSAKTRLAAQLVSLVTSRGGRFLKRADDDDDDVDNDNANNTNRGWYEVDPTVAHEKVSHALRSAKDKTNPRPRKKRKVIIPPPTKQEEGLCRTLYADQQQIFASMSMPEEQEQRQEEEPMITMAEAKGPARMAEAKMAPESVALEAKLEPGKDTTLAVDPPPPMDLDAFISWLNQHPEEVATAVEDV